MNHDERECPATHQVNLGNEQRTAGRDYYELVSPGSVEMLLLNSSRAKLDRMALDNSRLFRRRFSFEPPQAVRRQVLELQKRYDLTDREIRSLRYSGQMIISRTVAKLEATRLAPLTGWLQLSMLSIVCLDLILHITSSSAPLLRQIWGGSLVGATWIAGAWMLNYLYLAPWRLLKRVGVTPGRHASLDAGAE